MKKILVVFAFILAGCVLFKASSFAQLTGDTNVLPLTVFPAVQDKLVTPGESTRLQLQFKNNNQMFVSGQIKVADYIISDKRGTPILIEDQQNKPKYGAASWITPSYDEITISPNNYVTVDLFVTVPNEVASCGKYAIVYFQPSLTRLRGVNARTESASAINIKFGALVNFIVQDKLCRENMQILNLKTPGFLEFGPINTSFDLVNMGDVHIVPKGSVVLTDMFGKTVVSKSIEEQRIFPETAKEYKASLGPTWMIGRYKLQLDTNFGSKDFKRSALAYIWVFPVRSVAAIALALIIIILLLKNMYKAVAKKEELLEGELEEEKKEIEKLKEELRRKNGRK